LSKKMRTKSWQVLEYPKILTQLAEHTSFSLGHALALRLRPSSRENVVGQRQQETTEARRLLDIKPGDDDWAYEAMGKLKGDGVVTPLLIGRIFEESDIILLLHSDDLEALDDYLIKNVRKTEATPELVVVPI